MKVVIDIPDDIYNDIESLAKFPTHIAPILRNIIKNGQVLPKGHGDLIDRDTLNLDYEVSMADDWKTAHEIANCVKYAPTVIPADRENKE